MDDERRQWGGGGGNLNSHPAKESSAKIVSPEPQGVDVEYYTRADQSLHPARQQ